MGDTKIKDDFFIEKMPDDEEAIEARDKIQSYLERLRCLPQASPALTVNRLFHIVSQEYEKVTSAILFLPKLEENLGYSPYLRIDYNFARYQQSIEKINNHIKKYSELMNIKDVIRKTGDMEQLLAFVRSSDGKEMGNLDSKIFRKVDGLLRSLKNDKANLERALGYFQLIKDKAAANRDISTPSNSLRII